MNSNEVENVIDRTNLELIFHFQLNKYDNPNFKGIVDHCSTFSVYKVRKTLQQTHFLEVPVLELSKLLMFEFYYPTLEP